MRTFPKFPEQAICKICNTAEDKECILVPIDGTDDGNICEGVPIHVECFAQDTFRYNQELNLFYKLGYNHG